jgi:hypothetical protein
MSAPPHVHAHNFAKAILTDIVITLFRFGTDQDTSLKRLSPFPHSGCAPEAQKKVLITIALTLFR